MEKQSWRIKTAQIW